MRGVADKVGEESGEELSWTLRGTTEARELEATSSEMDAGVVAMEAEGAEEGAEEEGAEGRAEGRAEGGAEGGAEEEGAEDGAG